MPEWIRTCQSCGNKQKDNEPKEQGVMTEAYRNRKCKKCKSEDLDYGSNRNNKEEQEKFEQEMNS